MIANANTYWSFHRQGAARRHEENVQREHAKDRRGDGRSRASATQPARRPRVDDGDVGEIESRLHRPAGERAERGQWRSPTRNPPMGSVDSRRHCRAWRHKDSGTPRRRDRQSFDEAA